VNKRDFRVKMEPINTTNSLNLDKTEAMESLILASERTRLAAERTFLAWIRTGLTSVAGGLAVARLILFHTLEHKYIANLIGQFLILWGIVAFTFALITYHQSCKKLAQIQDDITSKWLINLLVISLALLAFLLFWIIAS
jgi:putative membrane protein